MQVKCNDCGKEFDLKDYLVSKHLSKYGGVLCRSCIQRRQYKEGKRSSKIGTYNKSQRGKTLEERLGKEKANSMKQKLSERLSGKLNPNYGGKYSKFEKAHQQQKGKTLEQWLGEEKANLMKQKISIATSGENNPMYGKSPSKLSGSGLKGYYKNIYFRSFLELSYLVQLDKNDIKVESAETEKFLVHYEFNGVNKTYKPDYYLVDTDEVIEIKWHRLLSSSIVQIKKIAALKQFNNYKIVTENEIDLLSLEDMKFLINQGILKIIRYSKYFKQLEAS